MRIALLTIFFLFSFQVFSQTEEIIVLKKTYKKNSTGDSIKLKFPEKKTIVLDSFIVKTEASQLNFLKDFSLLDNNKLVKNYKTHVFSGSKTREINQFSDSIIIYIDDKLDNKIKTNFIAFIENIPEIENLKFSFTKNIENANYFIDVANNEVSAFSEEYLAKLTTDEIKNYTFSKMTYRLYSNRDNKFISCRYKISPSIINNKLFLNKLKKGFIRSLGNFNESYRAPKTSFLSKNIDVNNTFLLDYDIMILKLHYNHLYQFKVNYNTLDSLIELRKKLTN